MRAEAPVAAVLITKGAQLLVIQNHKATSVDLVPTSRAHLMEWHSYPRRNGREHPRPPRGTLSLWTHRVRFRGHAWRHVLRGESPKRFKLVAGGQFK
jgi:hypothetical protein